MGFDQDGHLFITNTGWNSWEEIESGPAAPILAGPIMKAATTVFFYRRRDIKIFQPIRRVVRQAQRLFTPQLIAAPLQ